MDAPKKRIAHDELLRELAREHGTPLYIQDGDIVRGQVAKLAGFDVVRYAMKANSNLALLRVLREAGAHVDCVSEGELVRATAAGWGAEEVCFTSDLFDRRALERAVAIGCHVNLGTPDMIEQYAAASKGERRDITLRINPGFGHGHSKKVTTGGETSKHGIWHDDLEECVERAHRVGLEVSGLHMHIGSGSDFEHLKRVAQEMVRCAAVAGDDLRTISGGGGLPVPYRADEEPFDVHALTEIWCGARDEIARRSGRSIELEVEPGRFLVAEGGLLLTEVRGRKSLAGYPCLMVDAGFHTLARPMLYGAYHQISIVGRDDEPRRATMVGGPLCESSDVFTQDGAGEPAPQDLPEAEIGDLACIHDTGAYGASMATNYNSMPIAPEVLISNGEARLVRERQSMEHLLANENG